MRIYVPWAFELEKGRKHFGYFRHTLFTYEAAHGGAFMQNLHRIYEYTGKQTLAYLQSEGEI